MKDWPLIAFVGSSPLTRGKRIGFPGYRVVRGLIPAHAGKTGFTEYDHPAREAHPRSRGENQLTVDPTIFDDGSSPLTRGKLLDDKRCCRHRRLIPAHAGKTSSVARALMWTRAHPRSRGENDITFNGLSELTGSSPLTRGKPFVADLRATRAGLIPAHAGKTCPSSPLTISGQAHPRSRGENGTSQNPPDRRGGSSPLTRGKLAGAVVVRLNRGLIPAHAGKTGHTTRTQRRSRAHPRSRGENRSPRRRSSPAPGSSPLTRGKRAASAGCLSGAGLIPAHAGKTCGLRKGSRRGRAHPRSRGENTFI